jgi:DNA-binding transcriptional LysR family regulator
MKADPRLLPSFVVLAEELHFGRAAARLHIAQPALSQQIRRLEQQLGVTLFARTKRRVELTEAGAAVLAPARAAVDAARAAGEVAQAFAAGAAGELRLGLSPGAHYTSQKLLAAFAQRYPDVRVRASSQSSGVLAEQIARGDLDMAVGFCTDPVRGVVRERLLEEPAVVAVAADHPLAGRDRIALADLREETIALVDEREGPGYNRAVRALCRAAGFTPRTRGAGDGPMAWETAVRTHGCVGLTIRSAAVSTTRGVRLLELRPEARFSLELLRPRGDGLAPPARAFAALARELAAS